MQIISNDCKKLVKFMREYDKWKIKVFASGKYYVYRIIGGVEIQSWEYHVCIDGREEKWKNRFNFIESFYLSYEKNRLRKFKLEKYYRIKFDLLLGVIDENNK